MLSFAQRIVEFMMSQRMVIFTNHGEMNIVYVEGVDFEGRPIVDKWDEFNDPRIVFTFINGQPQIVHIGKATCEPGRKPTFSTSAKKRGGIFRIQHGQYLECWRDGFHKSKSDHPALVQIPGTRVLGFRDLNMDGFRTGDKVDVGSGINHHGTSPWYRNIIVSDWSEGCGVELQWQSHLKFVETYRSDIRYKADKNFKYTVTYIAGDVLNKAFPFGK